MLTFYPKLYHKPNPITPNFVNLPNEDILEINDILEKAGGFIESTRSSSKKTGDAL